MTLEQRFAENLKRLRQAGGWTQEELAYRSQIHRTQISLLETGKRLPRFFTLIKLAGALEASLNDLTVGITWEPAQFQPGNVVIGEP